MKHHLVAACAAAALGTFPLASASACSVVGDYRVPTNLELVEGAELVMLGRVIGENQTGEEGFDRAILVEPISAVKGELPLGPVTLDRMSLTEGEFERYGVLSNPYELVEAHPASYIGACIRYFFPRGTTALFFLERGDGGQWRSSGDAFSRWAEDVLTGDAPWLRLTRFYAEVAAAPAGERRTMLEAERTRLAALADDPVARLMAADIARQLTGPNPTWHEVMEGQMEAAQEGADLMAAVRQVDALEGSVGEEADQAGTMEDSAR